MIALWRSQLCILFVTWPHKTTPSRYYLQHATTLKSLVIIGILIVKKKNASSKTWIYKYVLPLKNWVYWITTRQEKYITTAKMYIFRRSAQKLKNIFSPHGYPLSLCFYNFTLKGYFHCKTVASQNVPSEAQIKNFLCCRKVMFCSQDIQVFVFLIIAWFTKSVT